MTEPSSSVLLTQSGVLQVAGIDHPSQISIGESDDKLSILITIDGLTRQFARSAIQAISISTAASRSWIDVEGELGIPTEVLAN